MRAELDAYQWQRDAGGQTLPRPRDQNNHLIDALRYALAGDMDARRAYTASKAAMGL